MINRNLVMCIAGLVLAAVFSFSGCGDKPASYKIGVIYPLTGEASFWGNNARNGAELAVQDFNARGGGQGYKVEVSYEDSKSVPKEAVNAANKLIFNDGAKFIVGDLASSNLLAIAPLCQQNKVVTIGQGSNPKIRDAGDYIFRTWPSDDLMGRAVAKFLNDTLLPKQPAILFVNNEYGKGLTEVVKKSLATAVSLEEGYDATTRDFRSIIQKIPRTSDALILVAYPEELPVILKQLAEARLNIPIIGTETFENENVKKISASYPNPIYYTVPRFADKDSAVYKDFIDRYKTKFGKEAGVPADPAYDAMMLILKGISAVGYDPQKVKDYLHGVKNYEGVSGIITFDEHGDVVKPYWIKKLLEGKESTVSEVQF